MHGRVKKDVVEPSPEEKEKQREQVRTARGLFGKLLELRQSKAYNEQALEMTSKALQFHPEFPTLWGYRRELLTSGMISKPLRELLEVEMKLLEKAGKSPISSVGHDREDIMRKSHRKVVFETCQFHIGRPTRRDIVMILNPGSLDCDKKMLGL